MKNKFKAKLFKILKIVVFWLVIAYLFKRFFPSRFPLAQDMSLRYIKEMIMIFPAVLIIMGLADIWVPTSLVKKYLGEKSGFKGKLFSFFWEHYQPDQCI